MFLLVLNTFVLATLFYYSDAYRTYKKWQNKMQLSGFCQPYQECYEKVLKS